MTRAGMLCRLLGVAVLAWAGLHGSAASAQPVLWNEHVQGDLSDNRLQPNQFALPSGSSHLNGFMAGEVGGVVDLDYYSITVPQGFELSQIILESYTSQDPVAFLAIQPGPIFPNDPGSVTPGELMGWIHLGAQHVGLDILPIMGSQGMGFTPPLAAGTYTFWAQQLGAPTDYLLEFVVVPAPAGAVAGLLMLGGIACRRKPRVALPASSPSAPREPSGRP